MIKAIFVDLDDTLLDENKGISKRNIDAINAARDKGVKFLFSTGRLPFCYTDFAKKVDLKDAVSANGAVLINDNKPIKINGLDKETATKLMNYAIDNHAYLRFFAYDFLYLLNRDPSIEHVTVYDDSKDVGEDEIRKIVASTDIIKCAFLHQKHSELERIKKELEKLNLNIEMSFSGVHYLEVTSIGQSKGEGIKEYCKLLNIDIKDTIGIGDNGNDISMLDVVGVKACPSNAIDSVKKICDYVSDLDCNQGAVGEIIEKFVLK